MEELVQVKSLSTESSLDFFMWRNSHSSNVIPSAPIKAAITLFSRPVAGFCDDSNGVGHK
jgi:hypothetical protein